MQFRTYIDYLQERLKHPLPGETAQRLMAPPSRKTMQELLNSAARYRDSSVLILIFPGADGTPQTILIKRPGGSAVHSGQIAFPGGKVDEADPDIEFTAKRETEEEVGIAVDRITILGTLSRLYIPASDFLVHPHIGMVDFQPEFTPNPHEVDAVLQVSVRNLVTLVPAQGKFNTSYGQLKAPFFHLEGNRIWGATAMMISEFREMTKSFWQPL